LVYDKNNIFRVYYYTIKNTSKSIILKLNYITFEYKPQIFAGLKKITTKLIFADLIYLLNT